MDLAAEWCAAMGDATPTCWDALIAPDATLHGIDPAGANVVGPAGMARVLGRLSGVFPLRRCEMEEALVSADRVSIRWTLRLSANPRLPMHRMHEAGCVRGITVLRVDQRRRIVNMWMSFGRWWA